MNKKYNYMFVILATGLIFQSGQMVFADNNISTTNVPPQTSVRGKMRGGDMGRGHFPMKDMSNMKPMVMGIVSAISGNTITINGKQDFKSTTTSVFSIDATNAKIMKNNVAGTVSSILIGDNVIVQGTLTGTNVVATMIRDEIAPMMRKNGETDQNDKNDKNEVNKILPVNMGTGQPIVAGSVTSINGNTVVITNKSNITYTIDATNSKVMQMNKVVNVSNINVGDMLVVQGAVNGTNVTATNIIDQPKVANSSTSNNQDKGFFAGVGSFFSKMFGF